MFHKRRKADFLVLKQVALSKSDHHLLLSEIVHYKTVNYKKNLKTTNFIRNKNVFI